MWPCPIRELEAYTSLAVRHAVHERVGGGYGAYWSRPEAQAWKEEEDRAWTTLNRIAGDSLTRDDGVLTSLVWAAAWHVTNHKYHCDEDAHRDWNRFCEQAQALSTALAAPDLSYNIQWLVWNCSWVAVHNCKHGYTQSHWNEGHDAARGFSIAAILGGVIAVPFTWGLSLAAVGAGAAGLSALPDGRHHAIRGRGTDYEGDVMRMEAHQENLEARQAGLADVYRRANMDAVWKLFMLVHKKVGHFSVAHLILRFLWTA
mmetsp:Transcript_47488/g.144215  ORF Transcript_47488/g.144215 Transcript_47488/m.144215 type:complete len:259 (-) Transcript_47488:115-891(-)